MNLESIYYPILEQSYPLNKKKHRKKIVLVIEDNGLSIINKTESPYYENEDPHDMQDFLRYVLGFVAR